MERDIKQVIEEHEKKTREHFDEKVEEVKGHFDVVAENLEHKISAVAEQVASNATNITQIQTTLEEHGARLTAIENTLVAVNLGELVKKVGDLERRLGILEEQQKA